MVLSVPGVRGRISSAASSESSMSAFLVIAALVAVQRAVGPVEQPGHGVQRARLVPGEAEADRDLVGPPGAAVEVTHLSLQTIPQNTGGLGPRVQHKQLLLRPDYTCN